MLSSFRGYQFSRVDINNEKTSSRYFHDDVTDMVLIYNDQDQMWNRGKSLVRRRFGHTSMLYARGLYHIGGGCNNDLLNNGAERWEYSYEKDDNGNLVNSQPINDVSAYSPVGNTEEFETPFKWVGDKVLQSRLFYYNRDDDAKNQFDNSHNQHILGRAHPIRDFYLRTTSLTDDERTANKWINEFDDVDQELDFFFDHAFTPNDRMFYGYNATKVCLRLFN